MTLRSICLIALTAVPLSLAACDKSETNADTNEPAASNSSDVDNLCSKYDSCDACISGEQLDGKDEGEAETVCGLAVTGCWSTWDKPVTCGSKSYEEQPS